MGEETEEEVNLMRDVKDSLMRQIEEMRKMIARKHREVAAYELQLMKEREQTTARVILRVLRRGKQLQSWRDALAESREGWTRDIASATASIDSYIQTLSSFKSHRNSTLHSILSLLPVSQEVLRRLRDTTGCFQVGEIEHILRPNEREKREITPIDGQLREVVLSTELQKMIGKQDKTPSKTFSSNTRPIHLKTRSCQVPMVPQDLSSHSESLVDAHYSSALNTSDKESSLEEEINRLAVLNSSIRLNREYQVSGEEGNKEQAVGMESGREIQGKERLAGGWRNALCRCWGKKGRKTREGLSDL